MKPKTLGSRRQIQSLSLPIFFAGVIATAPTAFATSATWDGGVGGTGTILNTGANWTGDVAPSASGDTATWDGTVAGSLVLNWNGGFSGSPEGTSLALSSTQTGNLTLDATGNFDFSLNSIMIASGAGAFTLGDGVGTVGSSGRIVFRGTTSGVSPQNSGYTNNLFTNNSSNTATWGADLNFGATSGAPRNLVFGGTGNWTINSNLNGVGVQITKNGAGTLSLTNTNNALDIVAINGGTLKVDGAGQLRAGNFTGTFINDGTFNYNSSSAQAISSSISGAGALIKGGGSSVLSLTGNNSYSGNTTIDSGTLQIAGGGQLGTGNYAGNISIASGAVLDHASSSYTTVGGATNRITGLGSITKSGTGTLRIESSQSFSGGINLTQGILEYNGSGALGTGTITVSAGQITARGGGGTLANNVVLNGNVQLGRSGVGSGMGFTGNFDMGGGVRTITMDGAPITLSGIISNGGLAKSGTSTLQISNTGNTYAAGTVLNAGILEYTGSGALGTGTVTINGGELTARGAGGTLANNFVVNGDVQLGRDGIGSGMGISGNVDLGGGTRTITTPGVNLTISGTISNGGLTKAGSNAITLTGNNSYTGATTVSAGSLFISGALGASNVSVSSGATIGAGDASGSLGGDLFFASGALLDVSLGTLSVADTATVSFGNFGFGNLIGFDVETAGLGTYTLIDGGFTLDSTNLANFGIANAYTRGDGNIAYFDNGSLAVTITAVPEPGAAVIGSIGFLLLLNRRRRR